MVVQHNLTAMNSNRMLNLTTAAQASATKKLSSGYKINTAADDAAGLSISEKMRRQIRGLTQASANAQDGISCVQTAEGALNEVTDMLQRMEELAVKGENGTLTSSDMVDIQNEVAQLMSEINRVQSTTTFNNQNLLTGEFQNKGLQVGAEAGQRIDINIKNMNMQGLVDATQINNVTYRLGNYAKPQQITADVAAKVVQRFSGLNVETADKNRLSGAATQLFEANELKAGESKQMSSISYKGFSKAGKDPSDASDLSYSGTPITQRDFSSLNAFVKSALKTVSAQRSELGAVQNRLEHTIKNLDNIAENTTAAEAAVRDTDMATTMVAFANAQVLAQAGTSMLAQANQQNQNVLSLLG